VARLADTLIGAAIAHLFSYVWPRWEFFEAPQIVRRLQAQLGAFAAGALKNSTPDHDYRLARKNVIEAIAALSDSAGRMSDEPIAARKGLEEMAALLIAAHGLIAQLSAARLATRADAPAPDEATRDWIQTRFGRKPDETQAPAIVPAGPLAAATLAVVEAALRYERAAKAEAREP
jgi:uncharacterized membrane protein YccC